MELETKQTPNATENVPIRVRWPEPIYLALVMFLNRIFRQK